MLQYLIKRYISQWFLSGVIISTELDDRSAGSRIIGESCAYLRECGMMSATIELLSVLW